MTDETLVYIFVLVIFFKIYTFTHLAISRDTTLHVFQDLEVYIICIFQLCKVLTNKCNWSLIFYIHAVPDDRITSTKINKMKFPCYW